VSTFSVDETQSDNWRNIQSRFTQDSVNPAEDWGLADRIFHPWVSAHACSKLYYRYVRTCHDLTVISTDDMEVLIIQGYVGDVGKHYVSGRFFL